MIKPILFNTQMVQAILPGEKTVTRRVVKLKYSNTHHEIKTDKYGTRLIEIQNDVEGETYGKNSDGTTWHRIRGYIEPQPPFKKHDILYVRETWNICNMNAEENEIVFIYRAGEREEDTAHTVKVSDEMFEKYDDSMAEDNPEWRPSIHMPKEAARIWLRVTDVRAERLQDITDEQAKSEGANWKNGRNIGWEEKLKRTAIDRYSEIWDSTIKKTDIERYGWSANPWVWVIEFERCENPEVDDGK